MSEFEKRVHGYNFKTKFNVLLKDNFTDPGVDKLTSTR